MAHIETWYRCPCGARYGERQKAVRCATSHICSEQWAVSHRYKGKAVRIFPCRAQGSMGSLEWAMQEAELSDNTEERKRQLEEKERRYNDG